MKKNTNVPSESTFTRNEFHGALTERDVCCIFTGYPEDMCHGMHIVPHARGDEVCGYLRCECVALA
jgi:hypothetical protein